MKNKTKRIPAANFRKLPADARRVLHPVFGFRCWLIEGKYYRSKNHYLYPPVVKKDGRPKIIDLSIENLLKLQAEHKKAQADHA